jgi:hypothetical protein
MAGHSFGAMTAQAQAGQAILVAGVERVFRDRGSRPSWR